MRTRKSRAEQRRSRILQYPNIVNEPVTQVIRYDTEDALNNKIFTLIEVDSKGIIVDPKYEAKQEVTAVNLYQ